MALTTNQKIALARAWRVLYKRGAEQGDRVAAETADRLAQEFPFHTVAPVITGPLAQTAEDKGGPELAA